MHFFDTTITQVFDLEQEVVEHFNHALGTSSSEKQLPLFKTCSLAINTKSPLWNFASCIFHLAQRIRPSFLSALPCNIGCSSYMDLTRSVIFIARFRWPLVMFSGLTSEVLKTVEIGVDGFRHVKAVIRATLLRSGDVLFSMALWKISTSCGQSSWRSWRSDSNARATQIRSFPNL